MSAPHRPSQAQLRRGEAATWGGPSPPRPAMRLLGWKPVIKNSLRGFADVELVRREHPDALDEGGAP
jgi:hypothetical protein